MNATIENTGMIVTEYEIPETGESRYTGGFVARNEHGEVIARGWDSQERLHDYLASKGYEVEYAS